MKSHICINIKTKQNNKKKNKHGEIKYQIKIIMTSGKGRMEWEKRIIQGVSTVFEMLIYLKYRYETNMEKC